MDEKKRDPEKPSDFDEEQAKLECFDEFHKRHQKLDFEANNSKLRKGDSLSF